MNLVPKSPIATQLIVDIIYVSYLNKHYHFKHYCFQECICHLNACCFQHYYFQYYICHLKFVIWVHYLHLPFEVYHLGALFTSAI